MFFKTVLFLSFITVLDANSLHLNKDDIFYEKYVKNAPNAKPILVKDTDSAMGRENLYPKKLTIKTIERVHGHFCDGLVLAYVELANTLPKLFKDGVVDRTDVRVVAKNSPCLVDTSALMSGARINFKTLSLDNSLGGSFIVQRISNGKTYKVSLRKEDFMRQVKAKEKAIKEKRAKHQKVTPQDIDEVEMLAFDAMKYMLYTDPNKLLKITPLPHYKFVFSIKDFNIRSDTINKNIARK